MWALLVDKNGSAVICKKGVFVILQCLKASKNKNVYIVCFYLQADQLTEEQIAGKIINMLLFFVFAHSLMLGLLLSCQQLLCC